MTTTGHISIVAAIIALSIWRISAGPPAGVRVGDFPEEGVQFVTSASEGSPAAELALAFAKAFNQEIWTDVRADAVSRPDGAIRFVSDARADGYRILIQADQLPAHSPSLKVIAKIGDSTAESKTFTFFAPPSTPGLTVRKLAAALDKASLQESVKAQLLALSVNSEWATGPAVGNDAANPKSPNQWTRKTLPDFPKFFMIVSVILGIYGFLRLFGKRYPGETEPKKSNPVIGLLCFLVFFLHVYALTKSHLPYLLSTGLMAFFVGILICRFDKSKWLPLFEIACLAALGSEWIFGRLLSLPLP